MHSAVVLRANTEYSFMSNGKLSEISSALSRARPAMRNGMGARTNGINRVHETPRTTK